MPVIYAIWKPFGDVMGHFSNITVGYANIMIKEIDSKSFIFKCECNDMMAQPMR